MRANTSRTLGWAAAIVASATLAAQEAPTLAVVGSRNISVNEFQMLMREVRRTGNTSTTLQTLTPTGREQLLNALIDKNLYAIGAQETGLDRTPEVKFWIDQAVTEVLAKKFLESRAQAVVVTDAALQEFYRQHPDFFVTPSTVKVRHIVLKSREEAEAVLAEAKTGKDFAKLAEERSEDSGTRTNGGDLGWVSRGIMVKPFEDLIFAMKQQQVGGVVQTHLGFHVVKVEDIEQPALPSFDSVKALAREKKIEAELRRVKAELMAKHAVRVHEDVLRSLK